MTPPKRDEQAKKAEGAAVEEGTATGEEEVQAEAAAPSGEGEAAAITEKQYRARVLELVSFETIEAFIGPEQAKDPIINGYRTQLAREQAEATAAEAPAIGEAEAATA